MHWNDSSLDALVALQSAFIYTRVVVGEVVARPTEPTRTLPFHHEPSRRFVVRGARPTRADPPVGVRGARPTRADPRLTLACAHLPLNASVCFITSPARRRVVVVTPSCVGRARRLGARPPIVRPSLVGVGGARPTRVAPTFVDSPTSVASVARPTRRPTHRFIFRLTRPRAPVGYNRPSPILR